MGVDYDIKEYDRQNREKKRQGKVDLQIDQINQADKDIREPWSIYPQYQNIPHKSDHQRQKYINRDQHRIKNNKGDDNGPEKCKPY